MLDQQILRNNLEALKSNLERRGLDIDIDFLVQQDEKRRAIKFEAEQARSCLLYTSPSPRDLSTSRMPSSA